MDPAEHPDLEWSDSVTGRMTLPITMILPTYNRRHVLERTIDSYRNLPVQLMVVDDGSLDGTAAWLRSAGVVCIRATRRVGLTQARNIGISLATTPWIMFGEDDVMMPSDTVTRLLQTAERLPRCGAICGFSYPTSSFELVPGAPGRRLLDPRTFSLDATVPGDQPVILPTLHARSLIRTDAARSIHGFDTRISGSAFREESDFFARLWHAGWACWYMPGPWEIHVRHRLGGGCRGAPNLLAKTANRWSYWRNDCRFIDRHSRAWRRWGQVPEPGTAKAISAWNIIRQAIKAGLDR